MNNPGDDLDNTLPLHTQVMELLPWHINKTLSEKEENLVLGHLKNCAQCQVDAAILSTLQAATLYPEPRLADVDHCFANISARLDSIQKNQPGIWSRLSTSILQLRRQWMPITLVIQMSLIFSMGILLTRSYTKPAAQYRGLSASHAESGNLTVIFAPDTSVRNMSRILQKYEANIVSGPTVTNAYVLRLPQARLSNAFLSLRTEPSIIFIESLTSQGFTRK